MRDLFGHAPVQATYPGREPGRRQEPASRYQPEPAPRPGPASRATHYIHVGNRSYSRDELLALSGFHEACVEHPDDLIVVVLTRKGGRAYTQLALFPRSQPDGLPPFWRHGEIMEVTIQAEPG